MKNELADLIFLSIREVRSIEELAERLVDRGVQIVPEGAMILTRAELDALNKYQERFKGQDAEAVIATEVAKEVIEDVATLLEANWKDIQHGVYWLTNGRCTPLRELLKTVENKYTEV